MNAPLPITACLLAACSFSESDAVGIGAQDAGVDAPAPDAAGPPSRFRDDFESWPVPESGTEGGFYAPWVDDGNEQWALLDLDGDGHLDLVHTADPDDSLRRVFGHQAGAPHWRVYLGSDLGFSSTATTWPVPVASYVNGFFTTGYVALWQLIDLDGDGRAELVELRNPQDGKTPWIDGDGPHWRVFENTGAGFALEYQRWPLPVPEDGPGFFSDTRRTSDDGAWSLADIDGDGAPDLVHTAPPGTPLYVWDHDAAPHWKIYFNEGSRFAETPVEWSVPDAEGWSRGFEATELNSWRLFDIDQDGALELVQTRTPGLAEVFHDGAQPVWWVYELEDGGFAPEPTLWPVPPTSMATGFMQIDVDDGSQQWRTFDLDGDGHLDLVHTADPSGEPPSVWGSPDSDSWRLYRGDGAGFAQEPTSWRVPDSGLADGFHATGRAADSRFWTTFDLDGDGQVELVQTGDPGVPGGRVWGAEDGAAHWRVYRVSR